MIKKKAFLSKNDMKYLKSGEDILKTKIIILHFEFKPFTCHLMHLNYICNFAFKDSKNMYMYFVDHV